MDRNEFKGKAKRSIDDLFSKIDEFELKMTKVDNKRRAEYEKALIDIKLKKEELNLKYQFLVNSSEEKWEEAKEAFYLSLDSFREGFSRLASVFK